MRILILFLLHLPLLSNCQYYTTDSITWNLFEVIEPGDSLCTHDWVHDESGVNIITSMCLVNHPPGYWCDEHFKNYRKKICLNCSRIEKEVQVYHQTYINPDSTGYAKVYSKFYPLTDTVDIKSDTLSYDNILISEFDTSLLVSRSNNYISFFMAPVWNVYFNDTTNVWTIETDDGVLNKQLDLSINKERITLYPKKSLSINDLIDLLQESSQKGLIRIISQKANYVTIKTIMGWESFLTHITNKLRK